MYWTGLKNFKQFLIAMVMVQIKINDVMITSVYCPPGHVINEKQDLDFLNTQVNIFIIIGDNAKPID